MSSELEFIMPLSGILEPLAYRIIESSNKIAPGLFRVFLLVQILFPALQKLLVQQLFHAFVNGLGEKVLFVDFDFFVAIIVILSDLKKGY